MCNELLWFSFAFLDLGLTVLIYMHFGKTGLYALIPFNLILCNIQVLKLVPLFGLITTLGNILYTGVFLTTNILCEFHGKKAARAGVALGFVLLIMSAVYTQITLLYKPDPSDFAQPHLEAIFSFFPRLTLASLTAYTCSQLHDVWAFEFWRRFTKGKWLWLRNWAATTASQFVDSLVFCCIAFWGMHEDGVFAQIFVTTFLFKAFATCLDTPFIYLARLAHKRRVRLGLELDSNSKETLTYSV